jgi:hypothetical protein
MSNPNTVLLDEYKQSTARIAVELHSKSVGKARAIGLVLVRKLKILNASYNL